MKTITIPKNFGYPTMEIIANGKHYELSSGKEITVEDNLAEVIENAIALAPKAAPQLVQSEAILVVTMKYAYANGGKEYYTCDTAYDDIAQAVGKKAVVAWYGGTQVFAKKTGEIISFTGLVRNGKHQYEWYYSTN